MLSSGMNVDPLMHIQILENKVAQAVLREAHMEAAIQQLISEGQSLSTKIIELEQEADDASADASG